MKNKIEIWNNLPDHEKRAFGDHHITHASNLEAWNKPFVNLSPNKQIRVLKGISDFIQIDFHGII